MLTDLYLIRHGQSFANVNPIIGGMTGDVGLTPLGLDQSRRLADRLRAEAFRPDRLYASTLPRAQQTAAEIASAIELSVVDDPELQELRPGAADGLSRDQWCARSPGLTTVRRACPTTRWPPGGESWAMFVARAGTALTRLVHNHPDETVAAVCHGGVIEASFYLAFGLGGSVNPVAFAPTNTGLTHWRYDAGAPAPWTLIRFNDATHLDD